MRCTPLTFLLTGFAWLLLASLLGIASLIGLVNGTPLPHWLRTIHVHGTLVGGVLQLIVGGFFVSLAQSSEHKKSYTPSRPGLYFVFNGATIALLISLWLGQSTLTGLAGLMIMSAVASLTTAAWRHLQEELNVPSCAGWVYRAALAALIMGLGIGVAMTFRLLPEYYAYARLLHLHLIVMGSFTVALFVATHQLLATLLQKKLSEASSLTRPALVALPIGFAALIAGFVTSSLRFELAVGIVLLATVGLSVFSLIGTWLRSGTLGNAASDHLLISVFFLLLTTVTGLAMGANYLPTPPILPIGSLHLVAYTHLAFIGFMAHSIIGALTYGIPLILAASRVPNPKKREHYREQLEAIMNRWRTAQLGAISLGTMGLAVLAALTWSLPLGSPYVLSAVWVSAGFLLIGLALFSAKLAWAVGLPPAAAHS